jgi:hypothetical protein
MNLQQEFFKDCLFFLQVLAIACLVATTQAGLLPAAAISTHGLALGPALAPAPALYGSTLLKAPLAAPALVKAAPSVDYVVSTSRRKLL